MNGNQGVGTMIEVGADKAIKELQSISNLLNNIQGNIDGIAKAVTKTDSITKSTTKNLTGSLKNINLDSVINNLTRGYRTIAKLTKGFVDYVEDLNLLKVAFGDTADEAKQFVENIADITGYDEATLVRMTATFRQLTSTLGLANKDADLLSKNLSKMALDISSLYNLDLGTAQYALQGALTAQPRSIKTHTGADITQDTLQAELARLGIDRKVKSLNQAENAIITYLSLERQLINSNGDLARTIDQPANMLRIFTEQIKRASRNIGNLFIPVIKTVIPYLTAFLMVFSEIVELLLGFFGIDTESFWEGMETPKNIDWVGGITNDLDKLTESAKKAQLGLRGFDKLNVIKTPSQGTTSGGIGGLGIDERLLNALDEYDLKLDSIRTKATEIRDRIMEWLGFTKNANGEFEFTKVTWGTIAGSILAIVAVVGALGKVYKILKGISSFFIGKGALSTLVGSGSATASGGMLSTIGTLVKTLGKGALVIGAIFASVYGIIKLLGGIDFDKEIENGVNKLDGASKKTQDNLQAIQDGVDGIVGSIHEVSWNKLALSPDGRKQIVDSIENLTSTLKEKIQNYVDESIKQLNYLYENGFITKDEYDKQIKLLEDYQKEQLNKVNAQNNTLIEKSKTLFDEQGNLITSNYAEFISMLDEYENDSLTSLTTNYDDLLTIQKNAENKSERQKREYYSKLLTQYAKDRDEAINSANKKYNNVIEYAKKTYGEESQMYSDIEKKARETRDSEITKAKETYNNIYDELASTTKNMALAIDRDDGHLKSSWEIFWDEFKKGAKEDLLELKNFFKLTPITLNITGKVSKSLEGVISGLTGKTASVNGYASGGFPNTGELYMARENGLSEYVGRIGNKPAVANNDQIVKAVSQGVTNAILSSGGIGNKPVVIEAKGDTSGLMNFITFKQKEEDMQYGN